MPLSMVMVQVLEHHLVQSVRITVSSGTIQSFGLTAGSDTTIHAGGA